MTGVVTIRFAPDREFPLRVVIVCSFIAIPSRHLRPVGAPSLHD